ncbi:unnamed protein product [Phyllotreta striolata]|uniref:GDP-fucose protein O-fucosyltransferase 2 n=1 Tax=Phyllotreta striolata TaxID=444603 RepID=A0A9N9XJQ3_PHYSR|nr:unnamed protein product [Phyllotreta striolata]
MNKILLTILFVLIYFCDASDVCYQKGGNCLDDNKRYLFYEVNRPEGFNLRRDVYLRFAMLARKMKESNDEKLNNIQLVLPPWSNLVHWKYTDKPEHIPWGYYFDVDSLKKFAPVVEMYEFFANYPNKYSKVEIEEVYTLQHFEDMFETGNFQDKMQLDNCNKDYHYSYFSYKNVTSKNTRCLSYHGPATKLSEIFSNSSAKTILIDHAEVALHDYFGSPLYWQARRSMRFNKDLKSIADEFRRKFLHSSDDKDGTRLPDDWTDETAKRSAVGGPYVGIHLRRKDFVRNRAEEVPTLMSVSEQVKTVLLQLNLNTVFVATDGTNEEYKTLVNLLDGFEVLRYTPDSNTKEKYGDGGVAIIDQIICSYARYFIGTYESTFTFRIQEEREIIGFKTETTFNVFCGRKDCPKPSVWEIVY